MLDELTFYRWSIEENLFYEVPIGSDRSIPWIIEFLEVDTVLITDSNDETNQYVGKREE